MDFNELIGMAAGSLTTLSFIPQVVKTWKSRSAEDISLGMFLLFSLGVLLWLVYGWAIGSFPIILFNLITLALSGSIIGMKLQFGRRRA
ncbi:MAG: hypothetical protein FIA97_14945 [Methylococcaceae bacterium]|nr:hypothetical protein [Methylococcaceae bacterium]